MMASESLVTGGAGFIGSNLVHRLLALGHSVRILDDFTTGRPDNLESCRDQIEMVEGDLRDPDILSSALKGIRYVFHLAAIASVVRSVENPGETNDVNITGTLNLLLEARNQGIERVAFSSSSAIYGQSEQLPKVEHMKPAPVSPYGLSKLTGEYYCSMFYDLYGLKTFSLRYFNVFGPRQNPESDYAAVIPAFIDAVRRGKSPVLHGDGGQTRDFTFVEDVVAANIACTTAPESASGGVYNIALGNRISILELANTIIKIMKSDVKPVHQEARLGDIRDSQADVSKAREQLGWNPAVTFEEGLKRTIDWYGAEG